MVAKEHWKKVMILIKHLQMNQFIALINPLWVDIQLN